MCRVRYVIWSLVFSTCLITMSSTSRAKVSGFKISDYIPERFTDLIWTVDGATNINGSNRNYTSELTPYIITRDNDNDSQAFRLSTYTSYRYETIPRFFNANILIRTDYQRKVDNSLTNNSSTEQFSQSSTEDKNYYKGVQVSPFLGVGVYVFHDFFLSTENSATLKYQERPRSRIRELYREYQPLQDISTSITIENISDVRRDYRLSSVALAGWGRMYNGVYASVALYIVDELDRYHLLMRQPTRNEMLTLAEIIYQYKETHAVDKRLQRIDALTVILDYLQQAGVIENPGGYGFALVQDVWDYFPQRGRYFGFKTSFGVGGTYNRNENDNTQLISRKEITVRNGDTLNYGVSCFHRQHYNEEISKHLFLTGRVNYQYPFHRKWQLSATGRINYDVYTDDYSTVSRRYYTTSGPREENITNINDRDTYYEITIDATVQYFLDNRTSLLFSSSYSYFKYTYTLLRRTTNYDIPGEGIQISPGQYERTWDYNIRTDITYRIFIPTTLHLGISYTIHHSNYTDTDTIIEDNNDTYGVQASIYHYIF